MIIIEKNENIIVTALLDLKMILTLCDFNLDMHHKASPASNKLHICLLMVGIWLGGELSPDYSDQSITFANKIYFFYVPYTMPQDKFKVDVWNDKSM